jgi:hypothetical protein
MLVTFQPAGVFTSTWFDQDRVFCASCPGAPIVYVIGA